jgi:gamma-glutamylcysteine synthetase
VKDDLARIIDWNFQVVVHVDRWFKGGLTSKGIVEVYLFGNVCFLMGSHDNFMSENINVSLHQWYGLYQDIKASADKINEEHFMVTDYAEHALVIVAGFERTEVHYDTLG